MKHKEFITSKILKGLGIVIAVALLCVIVAGCGEVSSEQLGVVTPVQPQGGAVLESIGAVPDQLTLYKNGSQQLSIIATYTGGKTEEVTAQCTYASSDRLVVAVDKEGYVVAFAPGEVTITVTYTDTKDSVMKTITIPVTVRQETCTSPGST